MSTPVPGTNACLIGGSVARGPELRALPGGSSALQLDIRVERPGGPPESAPVTWLDPPPVALRWVEGEAVLVTGRVRRRFFPSGGATQSRTEVVAESIVPLCQRARAARAVDALRARLGAA
jgi:single-stranded DNA-binding protein